MLTDLLVPGAAVFRMAAPADSLPAANTQAGNVFQDRSATNVAWYLPTFQLIAPTDSAFSFSASQTGVDANGNPFNRAILSFSLVQRMPDDASAYQTKNPQVTLQPIPLTGLTATLTTSAADPQTGAAHTNTFPARLATATDGSLTVTVDSLLGTAVIVAFENLKTGGASLQLAATYNVWHPQGVVRPIPWFPINHPIGGSPSPVYPHPITPIRRLPLMEVQPRFPVRPIGAPIIAPQPVGSEGTAAFSCAVTIGTAFGGAADAAKFTVTEGAVTHAIVSAADLTSYQTQQSEFSPFTALGDVSTTYPSFSALYIGALSRTIVAVPASYGIVRSSAGTAAVCQALLDSAAGSNTPCTFQFSFLLGPAISPIDLFALTQDLAKNPASHDCTVVLPAQIDTRTAPTVATPFTSSVACLAGAQPNTFALTLDIADGGAAGTPSVANANLVIEQLIASVQPFLVGSFAIKLDDAYVHPITVNAVLNFAVTSGSDDVGYSGDPSTGALTLSNASPLDLTITRYAVVGSDGTSAMHPLAQTLPAHGSTSVATAGAAAGAMLLVDRTIALESPLTKADTARYLDFELQDVQAVQYELGLLAGGVGFAARGIASITVAFTFDDLPQLTAPTMTLTALDQSANEAVALPIQYALSTLATTLRLTVTPTGATPTPTSFTLTNDFIATPVVVLTDASIPGFPASS